MEADREGGRAGNSALEGRLCGIWTEPPPSPAAVSGGVFRVKEAERRPSGAIWVVPRFLRPMIGAEVFFIDGPFAGKGRSSRAASGNCGNRGREVDPKTIGTGAVPAGLRHGPATAPEAGRGAASARRARGDPRQRAGREAAWGRRRGLPADRTVIHGAYRRLPRGFYGRGGGRRFLFSSDRRGAQRGRIRAIPDRGSDGRVGPAMAGSLSAEDCDASKSTFPAGSAAVGPAGTGWR